MNDIGRKIYRRVFLLIDKLRSFILKIHYVLMYKNIRFSGKTYLGRNVQLVCGNDSFLTITDSYISDYVVIHVGNSGTIDIKS